jgi:hypothetical protein
MELESNNVHRSSDEGKTWGLVSGVPAGESRLIYQHGFSKERAYIITGGKQHYYSSDRGLTWTSFDTGYEASGAIIFHATEPDYVIFGAVVCVQLDCKKSVCSSRLICIVSLYQKLL